MLSGGGGIILGIGVLSGGGIFVATGITVGLHYYFRKLDERKHRAMLKGQLNIIANRIKRGEQLEWTKKTG